MSATRRGEALEVPTQVINYILSVAELCDLPYNSANKKVALWISVSFQKCRTKFAQKLNAFVKVIITTRDTVQISTVRSHIHYFLPNRVVKMTTVYYYLSSAINSRHFDSTI